MAQAWLRSKLLPSYEELRFEGQLGGLPAQQTGVEIHGLKLHAAAGARTRTSTAVLFVDVRAAYHHLLRELVFSQHELVLAIELMQIFDPNIFDHAALADRLRHACKEHKSFIHPILQRLLDDVFFLPSNSRWLSPGRLSSRKDKASFG